jgi:predicted dehydrogenase
LKKVVVVGAGNWGKNLIRNFHALGALAGVADASELLREGVAQAYPDISIYRDFSEALATPHALVIATPAPTHYRLAKHALEAGKDIFVEKPFTLATREATELAEYADEHEQILMVGHLLLYQPAITWMRNYLRSGEAGSVLHVHTQRTKLGKVRREENVWWSFAPHDVSVVLELLGQPTLKRVQAHGHAMLQAGIEDNVHVDLTFETGQTAHLHSSWYWPLNERRTTVITERKMLVYNEVEQTVTVHDKGIDTDLNNRDEGSFMADVTDAEPLRLECQHFLECLETRSRPRSDGWNGVAVVEVLQRAQEALYG